MVAALNHYDKVVERIQDSCWRCMPALDLEFLVIGRKVTSNSFDGRNQFRNRSGAKERIPYTNVFRYRAGPVAAVVDWRPRLIDWGARLLDWVLRRNVRAIHNSCCQNNGWRLPAQSPK